MGEIAFSEFCRIMLIGCMGSGKSWLSKRIAEITQYPLYHLDVEQWKPGWVKMSRNEQIECQRKLIGGEKWIIDGTWGGTLELRYAAADLIIYLDMNRLLCMWSAAKRTGKKRSDLPAYLDEKGILSKAFLQLCKWIWIFPKNNQKRITELKTKYPEKAFLHLKSRREVNKLIKKQG